MFNSVKMQLLSSLVGLITGLGMQLLLVRLLPPEQFGLYAFAISVQQIFMIVQDGGFRVLLYRENARSTEDFPYSAEDVFGFANSHLLVVTTIAALVALLLPFSWGPVLAIAFVGGSAKTLASFISGVLMGADRFVDEAKWQIVIRILTSLAAVISAAAFPNAAIVILCIFVAQAIMLPSWSHKASVSPPLFKWAAKARLHAFTLSLLALFTALYFRTGLVVMSALDIDAIGIGAYGFVHRLIDASVMVIGPLGQIAFFKLRQDSNWLAGRYRRPLILLAYLVLAVAGALFVSVFSREVMTLLAGETYREQAPVLAWAVWTAPFIGPNYILMQSLLARGEDKGVVICAATTAVIALIANVLLISGNGAAGAAQALVLSELSMCMLLIGVHAIRAKRQS